MYIVRIHVLVAAGCFFSFSHFLPLFCSVLFLPRPCRHQQIPFCSHRICHGVAYPQPHCACFKPPFRSHLPSYRRVIGHTGHSTIHSSPFRHNLNRLFSLAVCSLSTSLSFNSAVRRHDLFRRIPLLPPALHNGP